MPCLTRFPVAAHLPRLAWTCLAQPPNGLCSRIPRRRRLLASTCLDLPNPTLQWPVFQDFPPSPPTCLDLPRLAQPSPPMACVPGFPARRRHLLASTCLDFPSPAPQWPVFQDLPPSPPTCLDLPRLAPNSPVPRDFPSPPTCLDLPILAYTCLHLHSPAAKSLYSRICSRRQTCLDLPRLA